jgi:hypothetical protein
MRTGQWLKQQLPDKLCALGDASTLVFAKALVWQISDLAKSKLSPEALSEQQSKGQVPKNTAP